MRARPTARRCSSVKGVGSLGAITLAQAVAANVPFSRQGSSTSFSKLTAGGRASWAMGDGFAFALQARGQASFGKPVFRAEQIALEGVDGLSAYVGGRTALDTGAVVRGELSANVKAPTPATVLSGLTPYAFGAFGSGRLERPTALEPGTISAFNLGAGCSPHRIQPDRDCGGICPRDRGPARPRQGQPHERERRLALLNRTAVRVTGRASLL